MLLTLRLRAGAVLYGRVRVRVRTVGRFGPAGNSEFMILNYSTFLALVRPVNVQQSHSSSSSSSRQSRSHATPTGVAALIN